MFDVRITVVRKASYPDLSARYENPIEHACDVQEGQVFVSVGGEKPEGLCDSAWESMAPFAKELARGGGDFYGGWMKNPKSAMISCNDGFRPVSFYLETIEPSRMGSDNCPQKKPPVSRGLLQNQSQSSLRVWRDTPGAPPWSTS